jgi:hypothetical protein
MKEVSAIEAIGALIIRLLMITLLIQGILFLPNIIFALQDYDAAQPYQLLNIIQTIVMIIGSILVWAFALKIVRLIAPNTTDEPISMEISGHDLIAMGTFLIGLYFLVSHLPRAVAYTFVEFCLFTETRADRFQSGLTRDLISSWLIVLLALLIAFRPKDLAKLFGYLRNFRPTTANRD